MDSEPFDDSIPGAYGHHFVELVRRFGVTEDELLGPYGLTAEQFADSQARIPARIVEAVVERARLLTGEPGLGIYLGLAVQVSWHGFYGLAIMAASNLREGLELAERFLPVRTQSVAMRLTEEGDLAALVIDEIHPLGTARDVRAFTLVVSLEQIARTLTGRDLTGTLEFAFPEPPYFQRFRHLFRNPVRFDQPAHRLVFPRSTLDLPFVMHDPATLQVAREACERELDALGFRSRVSGRVRALLRREPFAWLSVDEAARTLGLSTRTLKRRLAEESTTYSAILDEERRERALLLLRSPDLSMEDIAERLDYADAAAFTRAFVRWTGQSPSRFRRGEPAERRKSRSGAA